MAARTRKTTGSKASGKPAAKKSGKKSRSAAAASAATAAAPEDESAPAPNAEEATRAAAPTPRRSLEPRAHPDAGLTKTQVRLLHEKLLEERDRINARIRQRVGEATEDASPLAEEGDIAQRATEQDYLLRLADKQHKLLDQVLAAIAKMETGEYGICEGSEEPIGFRRLEIRPWARYSVEYKEQMDRRNR